MDLGWKNVSWKFGIRVFVGLGRGWLETESKLSAYFGSKPRLALVLGDVWSIDCCRGCDEPRLDASRDLVVSGFSCTLRPYRDPQGGSRWNVVRALGLVCLCGSTFESRLLAEYLHFCRIDHLGQMGYVIVWLAQVSYLITCVGSGLKDSRCGAETQVSRGLGSAW